MDRSRPGGPRSEEGVQRSCRRVLRRPPRRSRAARRDEEAGLRPRGPGDHRGVLGPPGGLGRQGGGPGRPGGRAAEVRDPGGGAGGYGDPPADARAGVAGAFGAGAGGGPDDAGEVLLRGGSWGPEAAARIA